MNWRIVRLIDSYLGIPLVCLFYIVNKRKIKSAGVSEGSKSFKKILFVKFWGIGNVMMILPAAYAIKEKYPDVEIDFLTLVSNKEVSEAINIYNQIFTIDASNFIKFIITALSNLMILRKRKFDLIIDFEQFARFSALLSFIIGKGKSAVGFNTKGQYRHFLYDRHFPYQDDVHTVKLFFKLVESTMAISNDYPDLVSIFCNQSDSDKIKNKLRDWGVAREDTIIILHLGTSRNFEQRRWPVKYFAELANRLVDIFNVKVIYTGLPGEEFLGKEAMGHAKNKRRIINAIGKLNLSQFISLIGVSDLIISADTAPVHIASCLSKPLVGLFGPNTPVLYGPWGEYSICFYKNLSCSPCITNYNSKINICRHPEGEGACMREISVDEVFLGIKNNYFDANAKFYLKK
jgi:heptosyltransferase-3